MKSIAEVTQLASQFDTDENLILVVDVEKKNIKKAESIKGINFNFVGKRNRVIFFKNDSGEIGRFRDCNIKVGNGNIISVEHTKWTIRSLKIVSSTSNYCKVLIGRNFSCGDVTISTSEGRDVVIGDNCMFAGDVQIRNSDFHSIFDANGNILNKGKDIYIDDHVWIAYGVFILKGVRIPRNCVIGAGSVVTKSFTETNSIIAGNPAKIIRNNINWNRSNPENYL